MVGLTFLRRTCLEDGRNVKPTTRAHVAVIKALKSGRIAKEADGTIDPVKADASWSRNSDPAQQRPAKQARKDRAPPPKPPSRDPEPDQGTPSASPSGAPAYAQSRAIREAYTARLTKLEYEERLGQLVRTDRVKIAWFQAMRVFRDRLLNLPARLAAQLAAETDERAVRALLDEEMRTALSDAADALPGTGLDR